LQTGKGESAGREQQEMIFFEMERPARLQKTSPKRVRLTNNSRKLRVSSIPRVRTLNRLLRRSKSPRKDTLPHCQTLKIFDEFDTEPYINPFTGQLITPVA
jgi:hypothetical protein